MHPGLRRDDRRRRLRPVRRAAVLPLRRLRRRRDVRARGRGRQGRPHSRLLPRDPAVPVRDGHQGAGRSGADRLGAGGGREALRARRGLGARAQRAGARVPGRVPALQDRPLPREDGPGRDPLPAVREHDVRADLEPQLHRVGADHDGGELRGRGPRALLRPGRRRPRRGREPPHAGGGGERDGAAGRRRRDHAEELDGLGVPGHAGGRPRPLRARAVRRLPRHRRRGGRLGDRDLRGAAPRDRELALVGRALLHPHGQAPAGHADGAAARLQAPAAARLRDQPGATVPSRTSWW